MESRQDNIRGVTLRVAIFFGLTTFTLCIGIFYIESILDDNKEVIARKDSVINSLEANLTEQQDMIRQNEHEINVLHEELRLLQDRKTESVTE